jgi:hypothetical protein
MYHFPQNATKLKMVVRNLAIVLGKCCKIINVLQKIKNYRIVVAWCCIPSSVLSIPCSCIILLASLFTQRALRFYACVSLVQMIG